MRVFFLIEPDPAKTDALREVESVGPEKHCRSVNRLQEEEGELREERFSSVEGKGERDGSLTQEAGLRLRSLEYTE